jgi:hypothetical protein
MLPEPDMDTTKRLMAEAGVHGKEAVAELSAAIMSANVCFLIGSIGAEKTAGILREWAAAVMRREMVKA